MARDIGEYHAGRVHLADSAIERRLFGRGAAAPEAWLGDALLRHGLHKFDEDAPDYALVRAALSLLPRTDMTLLDIGCGRGRVLLYAGLLGAPRVAGIEILPSRVALARRAAARHLPDGVMTVLEGDALALSWPDAEALIAMSPFYPSAWRRFRARLLAYAAARPVRIIAVAWLRDALAADRRFALVAQAQMEWIEIAAFELKI
ncbi:MAG TPA: class I SAM-dependent methyltransferase [Rhizomicrobium sp.]|nr:class I SAM-dependent methyltransferase [Rhizomicrobium sp.]